MTRWAAADLNRTRRLWELKEFPKRFRQEFASLVERGYSGMQSVVQTEAQANGQDVLAPGVWEECEGEPPRS